MSREFENNFNNFFDFRNCARWFANDALRLKSKKSEIRSKCIFDFIAIVRCNQRVCCFFDCFFSLHFLLKHKTKMTFVDCLLNRSDVNSSIMRHLFSTEHQFEVASKTSLIYLCLCVITLEIESTISLQDMSIDTRKYRSLRVTKEKSSLHFNHFSSITHV